MQTQLEYPMLDLPEAQMALQQVLAPQSRAPPAAGRAWTTQARAAVQLVVGFPLHLRMSPAPQHDLSWWETLENHATPWQPAIPLAADVNDSCASDSLQWSEKHYTPLNTECLVVEQILICNESGVDDTVVPLVLCQGTHSACPCANKVFEALHVQCCSDPQLLGKPSATK